MASCLDLATAVTQVKSSIVLVIMRVEKAHIRRVAMAGKHHGMQTRIPCLDAYQFLAPIGSALPGNVVSHPGMYLVVAEVRVENSAFRSLL